MRLLKVVAGLCAIFSLLILGVRAYGALHPDDNVLTALGFDTCDGKPCLVGVTPGITDWNDAYSALVMHFDSDAGSINANCFMYFGTEDLDIRGDRSCRDKTPITSLEVSTVNRGRSINPIHEVLLSDVIAKYGFPCGAYLHEPSGFSGILFLLYPYMEIRASALQLNTIFIPVDDIHIENPPIALDGCQTSELFTWHGFASITYYHNRLQRFLKAR